MKSSSQKIFCAFCRIPRRVYVKKHVTLTNIFLSLAMSLLFSLLVWQRLDPRGIFVFVIGLSAAETFIQVRRRLSLCCPYCGFDPVVYMNNPSQAARSVKSHLEERQGSPQSLLSSKNPLLNLPKRSLKERRDKKKDSLLTPSL